MTEPNEILLVLLRGVHLAKLTGSEHNLRYFEGPFKIP